MFENPHSDLFLFTCYEKNAFLFEYLSRNKRELSYNQILFETRCVRHQSKHSDFSNFWFFKLKSSSILSAEQIYRRHLVALFYHPVGSDRKNKIEWSQSSKTFFIIPPEHRLLSMTTKIGYFRWKRLEASQELFYSWPLNLNGRVFFFKSCTKCQWTPKYFVLLVLIFVRCWFCKYNRQDN